MQARMGFFSLAAVAVIAGGAYLVGRDACEKAKDLHVYVVSGQDDSQRSVGFEVVNQYLKNTDSGGKFAIHFAKVVDVQTASAALSRLNGSINPAAEGPLLVALDSSSADSKKKLRVALENASELHGERRRAALRATVPVLDWLSKTISNPCQQLSDDIEYASDNFGGIAFRVDGLGLDVLKQCARRKQ